MVAPKGAVCVFECLLANLALHKFFQAINFYFTRTTKHQPTRNLHSFTQLFAVMSTASQFHAYLSSMYDKIPQNSQVLTREMADYFIVFDHFPDKFLDFIFKLVICLKFFAYCRFPNYSTLLYSTLILKLNVAITISLVHGSTLV